MTQERCPRGESGDPRLGLAATGTDTTNRSPSVVDTRSGLLIVAHDLEHDPVRDLCRAEAGGCGPFGVDEVRAASAVFRCCREVACPLAVTR